MLRYYQAVYVVYDHGPVNAWQVDTDDGKPLMLYGGDADLSVEQNGTKDYRFGRDGIEDPSGDSGKLLGKCGVNQETGLIDANLDIEESCYGLKYSADANYIIFRDIALGDVYDSGNVEQPNWEPLMFSGT